MINFDNKLKDKNLHKWKSVAKYFPVDRFTEPKGSITLSFETLVMKKSY
jgi:hypothetical protein